jgi:hypothetical protein
MTNGNQKGPQMMKDKSRLWKYINGGMPQD